MLYFDVFVVSHTHKHVDYVCSVFHCHTYIYTSACASVCFVLFYCKRNHYSKCLENAVIRCVFTPRKGRGKKRERESELRELFLCLEELDDDQRMTQDHWNKTIATLNIWNCLEWYHTIRAAIKRTIHNTHTDTRMPETEQWQQWHAFK